MEKSGHFEGNPWTLKASLWRVCPPGGRNIQLEKNELNRNEFAGSSGEKASRCGKLVNLSVDVYSCESADV